MKAIRSIALIALVQSTAAIRFYDDDDDGMNDLVQKTSDSFKINPTFVIEKPDPNSRIGKFSFSQAMDFAEDKNLD